MKEDISLHNARECNPRQELCITSQRRGADGLAMFEDEVFVNRVEGLVRLVDASPERAVFAWLLRTLGS
ncbi:unnamed protein product [Penicillium roqueforti FM164]|uniref:Genomic scaffold, ProqFM164S01 n=1 Tax=Penicillium roqueforti (strain FM164) TaxID=1365484 RepID=W6Q143_PENRF|nr:unnamed protein product [Penicillium roqueforti FM164]